MEGFEMQHTVYIWMKRVGEDALQKLHPDYLSPCTVCVTLGGWGGGKVLAA
jgi:hypothetical protein